MLVLTAYTYKAAWYTIALTAHNVVIRIHKRSSSICIEFASFIPQRLKYEPQDLYDVPPPHDGYEFIVD
jgi:hypothetical protein